MIETEGNVCICANTTEEATARTTAGSLYGHFLLHEFI